jgi:predicted phosphodiesterase
MASESIDTVLVAGDSVGYYFWPAECLDMLESVNAHCIRGNHEEMVARGAVDPEFLIHLDTAYGPGHRIAVEQLGPTRATALAELPHPLEFSTQNGQVLLAHGTPTDLEQYAYPSLDDADIEVLVPEGIRWVVLGHTHYPMIRQASRGDVINPGSVGQQRNRILGAQWAVLDTEAESVNFHVTPYNVDAVVAECLIRAPENEYLRNVLMRHA